MRPCLGVSFGSIFQTMLNYEFDLYQYEIQLDVFFVPQAFFFIVVGSQFLINSVSFFTKQQLLYVTLALKYGKLGPVHAGEIFS